MPDKQCYNCHSSEIIEYNFVDIVKFLCAILVVSIHVVPFGSSDDQILKLLNFGIKNCFSRIAVPLFFVMSGFFLYRKMSVENFSLLPTKAYIIKLFRLYMIWTVIYFPFRIKSILTNGKGIVHGIFKYIKDIVFTGSHFHLWYFPALILSVAIISYLLSRKIELKRILSVAALFYAIGLLAQSWFGIIIPLRENVPELWAILKVLGKIIVTTRNGLFEGLLFVGVGAYFAFYGFKIQKKTAFICFVASYILMFIEAFVVKYFNFVREYDMYVFLVPLTFFAFILVLNWRIPSNNSIYKKIRILSSLIFYIHPCVKRFIIKIFNLIEFNIAKTCLLFLMTVIVSVGLSYLIYSISQRLHFMWLKRLYS